VRGVFVADRGHCRGDRQLAQQLLKLGVGAAQDHARLWPAAEQGQGRGEDLHGGQPGDAQAGDVDHDTAHVDQRSGECPGDHSDRLQIQVALQAQNPRAGVTGDLFNGQSDLLHQVGEPGTESPVGR